MRELKGRQVDDKKKLEKRYKCQSGWLSFRCKCNYREVLNCCCKYFAFSLVDGYLFAANAVKQKCLTIVADILHFHLHLVVSR